MTGSPPLVDLPLLDLLLRREAVSVDELERGFGWDARRTAAELERLRAAGGQLTQHAFAGLSLAAAPLSTWADYLRWRLDDPARAIEVYQKLGSTQDAARRLLEAAGERADGGLVIADEQAAGRGRLGRSWVTPPGAALALSRACVLAGPAAGQLDRLVFASCVGAAQAIEAATGGRVRIGIKWPNDLVIDGRKLAGILVEAAPSHGRSAAIIGIGVNISLHPEQLPDDPDLRSRVTSLAMAGAPVDRLLVLAALAEHLDRALAADPAPLLSQWRQRNTLTERVRLIHAGQPVEGYVVDLDPHEGLVVRTDQGALVHLPAASTSVA